MMDAAFQWSTLRLCPLTFQGFSGKLFISILQICASVILDEHNIIIQDLALFSFLCKLNNIQSLVHRMITGFIIIFQNIKDISKSILYISLLGSSDEKASRIIITGIKKLK